MTAILSVLLLGLLVAAILPVLAWVVGRSKRALWMQAGRKIQRGNQTVVAQYEAPARLRPAEVAFLYDRTFGEEELLATLLDLELRGVLKLSPIKGDKGNFRIDVQHKGKESDLAEYEADIIASCKHLPGEPTWQVLRADTVLWENSFETILGNGLTAKGLLEISKDREHFVQKMLFLVAVVASFVVLFLPVRPFGTGNISDVFPVGPQPSGEIKHLVGQDMASSSVQGDDPFTRLDSQVSLLFMVALCLVQAFLLYWSLRVSRSVYLRALNMEHGTKALRLLWPELDGYREFLEQVELDRIRFENTSDRQLVLNKTAPYAVALNLTTRWQDRFPG